MDDRWADREEKGVLTLSDCFCYTFTCCSKSHWPMTLKIRFLFKALDLDRTITSPPHPSLINEAIQLRKCSIEAEHKVINLKVYLRVAAPSGSFKYSALSSPAGEQLISAAREGSTLVVEFFHGSRGQAVKARLAGVSGQLQRRERELKVFINELKDESALFYAMETISKTSKTSFSDYEDIIQVTIVVSEPLVDCSRPQPFPLFYEQVDVCSHIERLRRASIAQCSLSIQVHRCHALKNDLMMVLDPGKKGKGTRIVVLFTRVEQKEGRIMISLEGASGEQFWQQAEELLRNSHVDLLIIIGIGAHLLSKVPYQRPLILLTSVSIEENRLADTNYNRDRFALAFLDNLFQRIFRRLPLSDSFSEARNEAKEHLSNYLWCCCLHEHAGDCRWAAVVQRVGSQQAHRLFRHTPQEWKGLKYYSLTKALQQIILGGQQDPNTIICAKDNLCCWNRQGVSKLQLHKDVSKILIWNRQQYPFSDGLLMSLKLNKFEGQACDRPLLRTRPLTLYQILKLVSLHRICVLRVQESSLARRLLTQAIDYMRCRDSSVLVCELEMEREVKLERQLFAYLQSLKPKPGGRFRFLIVIVERGESSGGGSAYEPFLQDHRVFLHNARLVYQLELALSFVVVTANPSFQGQYPTLHLSPQPHPQEKYFEILHNYRSQHFSPDNPLCQANIENLREQIQQGAVDTRQEVRQKCASLRLNDPSAFVFLGFLALFGEDGLYLTRSTTPILHQLFTLRVITSAIERQLPVESSTFPNCIYLLLPKPYREEFLESDSEACALKRLEYYNLLLRLYVRYLKTEPQSLLKSYLKKDGLFCISMEPDDAASTPLFRFFDGFMQKDLEETFHQHSNFKPIYHINQIQRIIADALKRKRARQFQAVKITSLPAQELAPAILLWSIMQKTCLLMHSLQKVFAERVRQLQAQLIIFFLKGEIRHTLIEIARIQLSLLLEQRPQKLTEGINHEHLSPLLTYLHLYALRLPALANTSPHKFREALYNCFSLLYKLKQACENQEVRVEFARHRLSAVLPDSVWYRELLRLIQRKTLFYFNCMRAKRIKGEEQRDFRGLLNMGQIRYEFQNLYQRLPIADRKDCDLLLLDHYIRISLNQALADNSLLFSISSGISPQLQPIHQHLNLRIDKRTLFSGKRLVVLGRARNSFVDGRPYIFNRKRYLTVPYLSQLLEGTALKSSYFNLTVPTLQHLCQAAPAEILHLLLSIDSDGEQLLIGAETSVEGVALPVSKLAEQLFGLNIKVLILMGRNAVTVAQKIAEYYECNPLPFIIALQSSVFSMNDYALHEWPPISPHYAWQYLQNEVYLMSMDFISLSVMHKINDKLKGGRVIFTLDAVTKIVEESIKNAKKILGLQFECTQQTFNTFRHQVWGQSMLIDKIEEGTFEDLTSKFYSSQHNFYHYNYYENVGRCKQILTLLEALRGRRYLVQVLGDRRSGKSTILHEVTWTAQIKGLFQLGISFYDARRNLEELRQFLQSRKFKEKDKTEAAGGGGGGGAEVAVMITIDNLDISVLEQYRELFEKLRNKAITILFSSEGKEVGARLMRYLGYGNAITIDLNRVQPRDIFGLLLSSIKDPSKLNTAQVCFTEEYVRQFQQRIQQIMSMVGGTSSGQIEKAIELLGGNSADGRHQAYYHFYKINYDNLLHKLKEKKELQIKIF